MASYQIKLNKKSQSITLKKVSREIKLFQTGRKGEKGDQGDPATNLVTSVNGQQGAVVLDYADVGADEAGSAAAVLQDANDYTDQEIAGLDTGVQSVIAGTNVTVDDTDPANPIVSALGGGGGASTWGSITGTLSDQTDLQTALDGKVSKNTLVYNVKDFGALGDNSTDDTSAIQDTLDAVGAAGGGTVYVPYGVYIISATLVIYSNTTLLVEKSATIKLKAGSVATMLMDYSHYSGDLTVPSIMENIHIIGGKWDRQNNTGTANDTHFIIIGGSKVSVSGVEFTSTNGKYAVLVQNAVYFTIENLYMNGTSSDGVHI